MNNDISCLLSWIQKSLSFTNFDMLDAVKFGIEDFEVCGLEDMGLDWLENRNLCYFNVLTWILHIKFFS